MSDLPTTRIAPPHFEDQAYRELVRSRRHQRPMSIIVMRPEHSPKRRLFRAAKVNKSLAQVREMVRRYDVVNSWAGFVAVLCPELGREGAQGIAERLDSLGQVGVATFPEDGSNLHSLIRLAAERAAGIEGPEVEPPLHLPGAEGDGSVGEASADDAELGQRDL